MGDMTLQPPLDQPRSARARRLFHGRQAIDTAVDTIAAGSYGLRIADGIDTCCDRLPRTD